MRLVVAPLVVAAVVLAAGCGAAREASTAGASELEGVPWVLTFGIDVEGWDNGVPSVTFHPRELGGFSGCNTYGVPYVLDGNTLEVRVRQLAQTTAGCSPPSDEAVFFGALGRVAGRRVEAGELVLLDGNDDELLRFGVATPVGRG